VIVLLLQVGWSIQPYGVLGVSQSSDYIGDPIFDEVSERKLVVAVSYEYRSAHGRTANLGIWVMNGIVRPYMFNYYPDMAVEVERNVPGEVQFTVTFPSSADYECSSDPNSEYSVKHSNEVVLWFSEHKEFGQIFYERSFAYEKDWCHTSPETETPQKADFSSVIAPVSAIALLIVISFGLVKWRRKKKLGPMSGGTKYCIKCRCHLPTSAVFCDACGTKQREDQSSAPQGRVPDCSHVDDAVLQ